MPVPTRGISLVRNAAPRIAEAALVPTALFAIVSGRFGLRPAIAVSVVYAYGMAARQYRRQGHASGMLTITCVLVTIRAIAAMVVNSGHFYFGLPVIETAAIGVMFLATVSSARPLVVRMASDLAPELGARLADRDCRHLVLRLSAIWMFVHVGIASTSMWLLTHETISVFVWAKIVNGWSWMLLGATATYIVTRPLLQARAVETRALVSV